MESSCSQRKRELQLATLPSLLLVCLDFLAQFTVLQPPPGRTLGLVKAIVLKEEVTPPPDPIPLPPPRLLYGTFNKQQGGWEPAWRELGKSALHCWLLQVDWRLICTPSIPVVLMNGLLSTWQCPEQPLLTLKRQQQAQSHRKGNRNNFESHWAGTAWFNNFRQSCLFLSTPTVLWQCPRNSKVSCLVSLGHISFYLQDSELLLQHMY